MSETGARVCDGDNAGRGRGDGDAGEAAKSLGLEATGAPLHGPARLPGRRRVDLPGHGRVGAPLAAGCYDCQPVRALWPPWQGFRRTKLEASGCEWMRPCDSDSKLADKNEKEEKKKEKRKKRKKIKKERKENIRYCVSH